MATSYPRRNGNGASSASAMASLMTTQSKNLDALTQANRAAFDRMQGMQRRQVEMACETANELSAMLRDFVQPNGSAEGWMSRQAEHSKRTFEIVWSNARELSDYMSQATSESLNMVTKSWSDAFDQVQEQAKTAEPGE